MKISFSKTFSVVAVLSFLMYASCGGESRPKEMPELYPSQITILQKGQKLEGASVILFNENSEQSRWIVGGVTDSNGICKLKTLGKFDGAPVGKYKVTVEKTTTTESETAKKPQPSDPKELEEYYIKITNEQKHYDHVDSKYKSSATTDLEIEIIAGKNEKNFDVGAAVQEEIILAQ
ncbi:MAG: hypothetical protein LBE18_08425 [Planctomycetaceae bacterium]|jgi:5-hydroxyisourate hydrolase-like protein (transthyretin family)|nr:hypothetical protein [Planctomycetaceae bacterium]